MAIFDLKWNVPYDFWKKRNTKKALYLYFLILNTILLFSLLSIYNVLNNLKLLLDTQKLVSFFIISAIVFFATNLVLFILWLLWRKSPRISDDEIGILFAPHSEPEVSDLIYSLYEQILIELKKSNILQIRCKFLPSNILITDPDKASEQLVNTGARLIVYGHFSRGNLENEIVEGFNKITFAVSHRNLHEIEKKPVIRDLASALAFRKFAFSGKNSFIEKSSVAENISEVALFFISVGLTIDGRVDDAIPLLENLLQKTTSRGNQPHFRYFENSIKSCLTVALSAQTMFYYETYLMDNITNRNYDNAANQLLVLVKKLLSLNHQTSDYYLQLGILQFHFGKLKSAWESIRRARALSPKNEPVSYFSLAFLCLWKEKFASSMKFYEMAIKCTNHNIRSIMQIILFLQGVLKNNPDKYQIRFALAFINDNFLDRSIAIEDYNSFLADAEKDHNLNQELILLVEYSQKRVEYLSLDK